MNYALHISGIFLSIIFIGIIFYFSEEVIDARWGYEWGDHGDLIYTAGNSSKYKELTIIASLWSLLFFTFFVGIQIWGLMRVKTTTMKVLSIIGISVSFVFIMWDFVMMFNPESISFDELRPAFGFYTLIMLAFMIVGLIQSIRYKKRVNLTFRVDKTDILDILDY